MSNQNIVVIICGLVRTREEYLARRLRSPSDHPPHPLCPACGRPFYKSRGGYPNRVQFRDPWRYCRNRKCPLYDTDFSTVEFPFKISIHEDFYTEGLEHADRIEKARAWRRLGRQQRGKD